MYDTLLFLHVLAAFALFATVVMFSAFVLGAPASPRAVLVTDVLWGVGGLGTLALGIWLALYVQGYELWDGWILGAVVLWAAATELGRRARADLELTPAVPGSVAGAAATTGQAALMHWLRTLAVLGILVLMVWKPGA